MSRYLIDGTMPDGSRHGLPEAKTPYFVFDRVEDRWVRAKLRFRWMAKLLVWWLDANQDRKIIARYRKFAHVDRLT